MYVFHKRTPLKFFTEILMCFWLTEWTVTESHKKRPSSVHIERQESQSQEHSSVSSPHCGFAQSLMGERGEGGSCPLPSASEREPSGCLDRHTRQELEPERAMANQDFFTTETESARHFRGFILFSSRSRCPEISC